MPEPSIRWGFPPGEKPLGATDVHVWAAALELSPEDQQWCEKTLAEDEHRRAGRFHFERDRKHFVAGRGILRALLGDYLRIEPGDVEFEYGPRGKPRLKGAGNMDPLQFNIAHSSGLLVMAVTKLGPVGIDVERLQPMEDFEEIVRRFFSEHTAGVFRALPGPQRMSAFFDLWTRHEACLKAAGEGLSDTKEPFEVSLAPGEPVCIKASSGQWTLTALQPAADYTAALAVASRDIKLSCWHWRR